MEIRKLLQAGGIFEAEGLFLESGVIRERIQKYAVGQLFQLSSQVPHGTMPRDPAAQDQQLLDPSRLLNLVGSS